MAFRESQRASTESAYCFRALNRSHRQKVWDRIKAPQLPKLGERFRVRPYVAITI